MDADGPVVGISDEPIPGLDTQLLAVEQRWLGPLPRPTDLAHYESVLPGAAERIVKMAENAASVRNDALRDTTNSEIDYARSGQRLAFILTAVAIAASIVFFALGNNVAGCAFLGLPVVMLVRSFLGKFGDSE